MVVERLQNAEHVLLHSSVYLNGVDVSYYLVGCTLDAVKIDPLKKFYLIKSSTNSDVGINLRKIGKNCDHLLSSSTESP